MQKRTWVFVFLGAFVSFLFLLSFSASFICRKLAQVCTQIWVKISRTGSRLNDDSKRVHEMASSIFDN